MAVSFFLEKRANKAGEVPIRVQINVKGMTYIGSPANIRGSLSEESTQPEHEEGQVGYASELSTEAFDFGVERFG